MDKGRQISCLGELYLFVLVYKAVLYHMLTDPPVVVVYAVLFMDWGEMAGREVVPFEGVFFAVHISKSLCQCIRRFANGFMM